MSFWDASDVVEWLRLQGVPNHGLAFAFRYGIDGETMDESVHLIVKDLQLSSIDDENLIIHKWRELADSGVEPDVVFGYTAESAQPSQPALEHSVEQAPTTPVPRDDTKNHPSANENYADDFEPDQTGEPKSIPVIQRIENSGDIRPMNPADDESIPDETPPILAQQSIAETIATDITSVEKQNGQGTSKQLPGQSARTTTARPAPAATVTPTVTPASAAPRVASEEFGAGSPYEAALRKQTELLRIQQERIRLQALMIERQRVQLQALESHEDLRNRPQAIYDEVPTETDPVRSRIYPTSAAAHPNHPSPYCEGGLGAAAGWGPGSPAMPVLQDSISMLSVSDVFDNASTDGNNQNTAVSAAEMGALYEGFADTPRQPAPSRALWQSTPHAAGEGNPLANSRMVAQVAHFSHGFAAAADAGYLTAHAGYTPAKPRSFPPTGSGAPGMSPIGPAELPWQHQGNPAVAASMADPPVGVNTQASVDSAGLVWHRKRPVHRPQTAPKSTSTHKPAAIPKLDFAQLPQQQREAHRAHISEEHSPASGGAGQTLVNHAHQAQRPTTAPHSRRRPSFAQSSHAPLRASLTARTTRTTSAAGSATAGAQLPPPLEAVQRAFDTARDAAIAQLLTWNRTQLGHQHHLSADPARATASSARRDSERTRSPPVQRRERPEKAAYGPNGAHWQDQLRQYEPSGNSPPSSPGRRRVSSAMKSATGEGRDTTVTREGVQQRQGKGSKFERLIGKLAKQYGMDPAAPDTTRSSLPVDRHFHDTKDSTFGHQRYTAGPVHSWEGLTHPQPQQQPQQRKTGEACIMLECGSGTVRDGPSYAAPLKRPDEPPLYPQYSPRRPAASRPGSRSATKRGIGAGSAT